MGFKIKEIREEQRMTQEELAKKSGVSRSTIIAMEANENKNFMMSTIVKIARALGKTVDEILFFAPVA